MRLGSEREDDAGEFTGHGERPRAIRHACRYQTDELRNGCTDRHVLRRNPDQARPRLTRSCHVGVEGVRPVRSGAPSLDSLRDNVGSEKGWNADARGVQISGRDIEELSKVLTSIRTVEPR